LNPLGWHTIGKVLFCIVWAILMVYVINQVKKPTRWVGRIFAWIMNMSHSSLTDWGLEHVQIKEDFVILDVGCGGGRTIEKLAAMAPNGTVFGVDYAAGSVAASRAKNAELINAGRVDIHQALVSALPFPDIRFDLVTAVETQYYWPDLVNDMREILRVLKPGGKLIVILESYKRGTYNWLQRPVMKLLKASNLGVDEHRALFAAAGYTDIEIFEERGKGWICCVGKKLS
jgi:ubiquinone/menaquinone biosynthesis C-methylase UbiE